MLYLYTTHKGVWWTGLRQMSVLTVNVGSGLTSKVAVVACVKLQQTIFNMFHLHYSSMV